MSYSLSITADQGPLAEETIVPVEVMPLSGSSEMQEGIIAGRSAYVASGLDAGTYLVRVSLPNGKRAQSTVEVPQQGQVVFQSSIASNEDLNILQQTRKQVAVSVDLPAPPTVSTWISTGGSVGRAFSASEVEYESAPEDGYFIASVPGDNLSATLWARSTGRATLETIGPTQLAPYSQPTGAVIGKYSIDDPRAYCLGLESETVQRWLMLPVEKPCVVAVLHQEDGPDKTGVSVSSFDSRLESMMSALQSRSGSLNLIANSLIEGASSSSLTSQCAEAYVLLRTGKLTADRLGGVASLSKSLPFSDGYLLAARLALQARSVNDSATSGPVNEQVLMANFHGLDFNKFVSTGSLGVILTFLEAAFAEYPTPLFTEGYFVFQEIVNFLDSEPSASGPSSTGLIYGGARGVLNQVGLSLVTPQIDLLPDIDWHARYTAIVRKRYGTAGETGITDPFVVAGKIS